MPEGIQPTAETLLERARDLRWWGIRHHLLGDDLLDESQRLERQAAGLADVSPPEVSGGPASNRELDWW